MVILFNAMAFDLFFLQTQNLRRESILTNKSLYMQHFWLQPYSISIILIKKDTQQTTRSGENSSAVCSKYLLIFV